MRGPNVSPQNTNPQPWLLKPVPKYKRSSLLPSTRPSDAPTKEKAANHPNGNLTVEEEEVLPEEEAEVEEEEATQDRDLRELRHPEETQSPPDPISPLTYDPFPAPTMQSQWENSPTSSMEIGPRQRHSSIS